MRKRLSVIFSIRSLISLALVGLLGACSTLSETVPDGTSGEALSGFEIPKQWSAEADQSVSQAWHQVIASESLDSLIKEALAHNQDIKASASRVLAARSQAEITSGKLWPEIEASFEGRRQRAASGMTTNNYSLGLNLSWELDVWGRLSDSEQAALMSYQEQTFLYQSAKQSLAAQVALAWIEAIESKRQYQLAKAQEKSLKDSLDVIEDGFKSGVREALDVYSARAEWINGQTAVLERQQTVNQALRDLSVLLGRYPSLVNDIPDALPINLPTLRTNLSSRLLEQRPDVRAAYAAVMSQQSNVLVAGANRLPRFTLTGSVGASSDTLSDVLRGDELIWNALGGLTAPIFNAGQLANEEQRQQHLLEAAIAEYRQTALTAFSEVEQSIDNDHWIAQQMATAKDAVAVSKQAEQQAFESYLSGLDNLNTWLQSQRTAFERTSRLMQLETSYFQNRIQLHQALGGQFVVFASSDGASQASSDELVFVQEP
ncbi:efflux transporter outer membrane subunit [Litoribrevibacter albus]|uniref:Membrane protein n=1 Tax=Litoribrevibacter albus TaxID=1473156 RepID=A0AA37SEC2_9GAMM|nr:efflux transporter outer membrane subunit [Litoribrevibacter albus]GLQ32762.1 membrane protein [Litoribrevibacter albus]